MDNEGTEATSGSGPESLDQVADELYGLLPAEFTSARNDRASSARRAGHKDLAAAIKKLARPTTSAWLANRLVRDRGAAVDQLLALGSAMRRAQNNLKANDLRQMSAQRHKIINEFVTQARTLAANSGISMSASTERELTATLEAAIADEDASQALRTGHLAAALSYSGFGAAAFPVPEEAVPEEAGPEEAGPAEAGPAEDPAPHDAVRDVRDEQLAARRQARHDARKALSEAQDSAAQRRRQADEREGDAAVCRAQHERLVDAITKLEAQLASARSEEIVAARDLEMALHAAEAAARRAQEADAAVAERQHLVAQLSDDDQTRSTGPPRADAID